jgi:hypothetical protein
VAAEQMQVVDRGADDELRPAAAQARAQS